MTCEVKGSILILVRQTVILCVTIYRTTNNTLLILQEVLSEILCRAHMYGDHCLKHEEEINMTMYTYNGSIIVIEIILR